MKRDALPGRASRSRARDRATPPPAAAPLLLVDAALASLFLCGIAFLARNAISPDSVAYFENAELFASGRWTEAVQGYWSAGYSLLLAPFVWLAGDDRAAFLTIAHLVQAMLGVTALWTARAAVQRRVPPLAQRAVYWGCAWVILRWLTQELLTPDLLLCVLLLVFVAGLPARSAWGRLWLGVIAGAGFIVKSSVWPGLVVAVAVVVLRCVREREWRTFPRASVASGTMVVAAYVFALSVHAGRPTLGEVGPLNVRWYLGDLSRRTPDTDHGPHAAKHQLALPSGVTVPVYDLRPSTRTYAPWSDPEGWARGVPATSVSALNAAQMVHSWKQNAGEVLRWFLPLIIGLALIVPWGGEPGVSRWWRRALDRPLLLVAASIALVFLAVHAEHRLLAPAALLCLLGAWRSGEADAPVWRLTWVTRVLILGVAAQLALYVSSYAPQSLKRVDAERPFHEYFDKQLALGKPPGVIIIGPADVWSGLLWRHRMHVAVQIGGEGEPQVRALSDEQRVQWLHDAFGNDVMGFGYATVSKTGGSASIRLGFTAW